MGVHSGPNLSSGHIGANRSVEVFRERFYSSRTLTELRSRMQTIVDACGCHVSKQSDSRNRGLISSLPIPYCPLRGFHPRPTSLWWWL